MRTALYLLALLCPMGVMAAEPDDDFSFLEEGEANRAKVEADRAPNANIFLEEDDDEDDQSMWSAPTENSAATMEIDDVGDGTEGFDPQPSAFEMEDPAEDMEGFGPSMHNLEPLGDHFPLSVGQSPLGVAVAELPVLVARNNDDTQADMWLVADIYTDGIKTGESRHFVSRDSISQTGPTFVWFKATVPVGGPSGVVEFRVFSAVDGKKEQALFSRNVKY